MSTVTLPEAATPEGRAGLAALLSSPRHALIATDFDGTLAPIVPDPRDARALPGTGAVLSALAAAVGTVAVITGRPAADAVAYGDLAGVPGLIVLGHYGLQRWEDGELSTPQPPPAIDEARAALPDLLRAVGAPDGIWVEKKEYAVAVHTRRTADPDAVLDRLREPLTELAAALGLTAEPGRKVIELRPRGVDKGSALSLLVTERTARSVLMIGDDLGDLSAFAVVRALRGEGIAGCTVASRSPEAPEVAAAADLVTEGPDGVLGLLGAIAGRLGPAG